MPEHQEIQKKLDYFNRKKQDERDKKNKKIDNENLELYNRLTKCQPTYKYNDWVEQHDQREQYLSRIIKKPMRLHHNPSPERIRLNVIASAREEINPLKEYKRK